MQIDPQVQETLMVMCACCHMIKDEAGRWIVPAPEMPEAPAQLVSHGICPACIDRYYAPVH